MSSYAANLQHTLSRQSTIRQRGRIVQQLINIGGADVGAGID